MISIFLNVLLVIVLTLLLIINTFLPAVLNIQIFVVVSILALIPVIWGVYTGVKQKEVNTDLLALVALVFAYIAGEWHSAAFINLMLSSARIFDLWTTRRSKNLIESLMKYRVNEVKIKSGDKIETKKLEDVKVNDLVIVEAGSRIPIDGIITEGQISVDESTLTGESIPKTKLIGDGVFSPTLVVSGVCIFRVTKIAQESTLAKITALVEEASVKKAKIVKKASTFTKWYILITFVGSLVIYFFTKDVRFVLSVLLVVCADDIAVAVPLTFTAAVVRASEKGILIKSADVLEKIGKIKTFITDKTGTLTFGRPKIVKIMILGKITERKFLTYLGAIESNSNHPIAKPVVEYIKNKGIKIRVTQKPKESPGEGVQTILDSKKIAAGKINFLKNLGVHFDQTTQKEMDKLSLQGFSLSALSINGKATGIIVFEDKLRPSAKKVSAITKKLGAKDWIMLTGDNQIIAQKIATETGMDNVKTDLTPKEKLEFIEKFKKENPNSQTAMIGDGVNDAAALALADVGIAMGVVGSDVAIDASDISLMDDNLIKIPAAMKLGKQTLKIINEIFGIWAITNITGLILVFAGVLSPTGAATYNFLTDFLPIFNALRVGTDLQKITE